MVTPGGSRAREHELQVIGSALRSIAEEMGAVLVRSAFSANIKERRDCSTALFDERGRMIAQAEHIPSTSARCRTPSRPSSPSGRPTARSSSSTTPTGGTHLPDITLVSPTTLGFAVSRAHHADVGGREPGSMPADSRSLEDEGVVIPPTRAWTRPPSSPSSRACAIPRSAGATSAPSSQLTGWRSDGSPSCATAAAGTGSGGDGRALRPFGADRARAARRLAGRHLRGGRRARGRDRRLEIRVAVTIAGDEIRFDFAGSAARHDGNLNCPLSVTRSACYFVVRCLTAPDLPASGGAFAPVSVAAPPGSLVNAERPPQSRPATSRPRAASSTFASARSATRSGAGPGQGTMNNLTLGNERFTYYETIGGGQGACADADGPSGVHVTMSNTLTTPAEALELAYPLRVERHALRSGSGGEGRHRGGDGVVRELRVLEPCRLSLITERRAHAPQGHTAAPLAPGPEPPERRRAARQGDSRPRSRRRHPHRDPRGGAFG